MDVLVSLGGEDLSWDVSRAELPENFTLVNWSDINMTSMNQSYDVIVIHTVRDLKYFWGFKGKVVFIAHLALFKSNLFEFLKSSIKKYVLDRYARKHSLEIVAISPWKLTTWNRRGVVIPVGFSDKIEELIRMKDSSQKNRHLVTVGNDLANRKEFDRQLYDAVITEHNLTVIGKNHGFHNMLTPKTRPSYLRELSCFRIYVYSVKIGYDDGYNLAMLEAMALGLCVLSLDHQSSIIEHKKTGIIAKTPEELLQWINILNTDRELAKRLGQNAHEMVLEKFSDEMITGKWKHFKEQKLALG